MVIAAKVTRRHDETAPRLSSDLKTRFVEIEITLDDGSTIHRRFDGLPGVSDPTAKFHEATGHHPAVASVPDLVRRMTSRDDLQHLLELLGQELA
jgi:hypothetical protein